MARPQVAWARPASAGSTRICASPTTTATTIPPEGAAHAVGFGHGDAHVATCRLPHLPMKNQAQLITYADRLPGGTFRDLQRLLEGAFAWAFGGVHVLPFFHPIDGADAGFDPIDHTQVDPRLGTWDDVAALAARTDVMADVIVNHVSRHSPQFLDYDARGESSPYAGLFLTYDRVFPDGAREPELAVLHTPRPLLPFTKHIHERSDRYRRAAPPGAAVPRRCALTSAYRRDPGHPARRSRLRDQEGRHELLHDPGDVCLHRRDHRAGARARHRGARRSPRALSGSDRGSTPGRLGVRLRPAAADAAHDLHARQLGSE